MNCCSGGRKEAGQEWLDVDEMHSRYPCILFDIADIGAATTEEMDAARQGAMDAAHKSSREGLGYFDGNRQSFRQLYQRLIALGAEEQDYLPFMERGGFDNKASDLITIAWFSCTNKSVSGLQADLEKYRREGRGHSSEDCQYAWKQIEAAFCRHAEHEDDGRLRSDIVVAFARVQAGFFPDAADPLRTRDDFQAKRADVHTFAACWVLQELGSYFRRPDVLAAMRAQHKHVTISKIWNSTYTTCCGVIKGTVSWDGSLPWERDPTVRPTVPEKDSEPIAKRLRSRGGSSS